MATKKAKAKQAASTTTTPAVEQPKAVLKLQVTKKDAKFRGARDAWYTVLCAHDGKMVSDFLSTTKENPPSLPKSGVAENPTGWLRYFIRSGVCKTVAA